MHPEMELIMSTAKEQVLKTNTEKGIMLTVQYNASMTMAYIVRKKLGIVGLHDIVIVFDKENQAEETFKLLENTQAMYTSKYPPVLS
jgi:hypothetical protein